MNGNEGMPMMMAIPWGGLPWHGQQEREDSYRPVEIPPRVTMAMNLVHLLARKHSAEMAHEMTRNEGYSEGKGQDLTDEDRMAHAAAMQTLAEYFKGKLKLCDWDRPRRDQVRKGKGKGKYDLPNGVEPAPQLRIPCPVCSHVNMNQQTGYVCRVCLGVKEVMIAQITPGGPIIRTSNASKG